MAREAETRHSPSEGQRTVKAICPTDPTHNRFVTVAHVTQDWVVSGDGTFVDVFGDGETVHAPHPGNTWTCLDCDTEATVTG